MIEPLWAFGLFADAQYGEIPDEPAKADASRVKRFRQAPTDQLPKAVAAFASAPHCAWVAQLGDLIESPKAHLADRDSHRADLERVLSVLAPLAVPLHRFALVVVAVVANATHTHADVVLFGAALQSVLGNHCLRGVPRAELIERLGMPAAFYTFDSKTHRCVVLDAFDISCGDMASSAAAWRDAERVESIFFSFFFFR